MKTDENFWKKENLGYKSSTMNQEQGRMTYAIGKAHADAKLFPITLSAPDCGIIFAVDTTRKEQLQ